MAILNIFSKRNAPPKPDGDVLQYDKLPEPLRMQIVHIWVETLGIANDFDRYGLELSPSFTVWSEIEKSLAREYGLPRLAQGDTPFEAVANFFSSPGQRIERLIDVVELSFRMIETWAYQQRRSFEVRGSGMKCSPEQAVTELNHRFLEHGVGYQFEHGQIIKVDTTYTHAEVIKPALSVLSDRRFKNAQSEFLSAHQAYREQRNKDCLNECLKAFESTMKIICHERGWAYQPTDPASKLIEVVFNHGLLPGALQTQFNSLKSMLESGTPTARNKLSGHGQGATEVSVPDYLARYGLSTAAANIVLLVEAFNALP